MINKREKLQYAYVFTLDLVTLFISVLLAWLITDGLLGRIVPYSISDWVQTICLVVVAFIMTFFFFNQRENIVTRSTGREFALSVRFNVLMAAVYSSLMLLAKAEMLDSRYFAVAVPLVNALMMPAAHMLLKQYLLRSQNRSGMESLAGVLSTVDHASAVIRELRDDWSKRVCGVVLLDAPAEQVGQEFEGVPVRANFDNFMDWIRRAALDEIYVDIPMDSGESFIPYLEEMESMGLTVHFRLKMLDRIEEVCCDETSAARLRRELGRCAGGNIVTMGTIELELRDMMLKRIMDIGGAGRLSDQYSHHCHRCHSFETGKPRPVDFQTEAGRVERPVFLHPQAAQHVCGCRGP